MWMTTTLRIPYAQVNYLLLLTACITVLSGSSCPQRSNQYPGIIHTAYAELLEKEIDSFPVEELLLWVPRKKNRDREFEPLALGRGHVQPLRLIGSGHEGFFEDTLRPDDNVLQIEMNIWESPQ